jgi:hypothetical protein
MQLFGMVGFAEGEWAMMILELWLGTIIVAVLALTALVLRSINFGTAALMFGNTALVVDLIVALVYVPWHAFLAAPGDDTDWHSLLRAWRSAATVWVVVSVAAWVILLWVVVRYSRRLREQPDSGDDLVRADAGPRPGACRQCATTLPAGSGRYCRTCRARSGL